jgi:hypothetical protein
VVSAADEVDEFFNVPISSGHTKAKVQSASNRNVYQKEKYNVSGKSGAAGA